MNKTLALVFVFVVLSSLTVLTAKSVNAQATSKPSVPQFTVKLVDYSYDVPPSTTTTVDQYTGEKTTTTTPGYRVENKTIEITIENQPFTPYTDANGITYYLYYNVQSKGSFGEDWQNWGSTVQTINPWGGGFWGPTSEYSQGNLVSGSANYATGAQVDFRVEAVIGHNVCVAPDSMLGFYVFETDVSSGWSKVQTFTMSGVSSAQPTSSNNFSNNHPETSDNNQQQSEQNQLPDFMFNPFFLLGIGALVGVGVTLVVLVFFRRHQPRLQTNS